MAQHPWLDPSPFFLPGGSISCLLVHGFTGSPPELRPMGDYLAQRGLTVSAPVLAGHGTRPEDLEGIRWRDWFASVSDAYRELRGHSDKVYVAGYSLGSLLVTHLARYVDLAGLILIAPAFWQGRPQRPVSTVWRHSVQYVIKPDTTPWNTDPEASKRFWSYEEYPLTALHELRLLQVRARRDLGHVLRPSLVICGGKDIVVAARAGPSTYARLASPDKELVCLENSGHGLVVDVEHSTVFDKMYGWIASRAR